MQIKGTLIFTSLLVLVFSGCTDNGSNRPKPQQSIERPETSTQKESKVKTASKSGLTSYYRTSALRKQLVGMNLTDARNKFEFGELETLSGTSSQQWLTYVSAKKMTVLIDKNSDQIINVCDGKNSQLLNDQSMALQDHVGKKYTHDEYRKIVNVSKFGKAERLGNENCLNKDCIEYFPKSNLTTLAFYEASNDGDFVELKRVAFGKLSQIDQVEDGNLDQYFLAEVKSPTKSEYSQSVENDPEFKKLRDGSKVLGKWFVKNKYASSIKYQLEIHEKDGKYFEVQISDDNPSIKELQKKGNKYIDPKSKHGDYLTIDNAQLRYFDNQGEITDYLSTSIK